MYIKPTNYCTVDCEHCYLPVETRANKTVMDNETFKRVVELGVNTAKMEGKDTLHFIWHGGEPLMLPPEYYYEKGEILDQMLPKGSFTESMQTSLIPFKQRFVQLIHDRYGSCLGSSVDFTQRKIHDSTDEYLNLLMKKVWLARDNGIYVCCSMVPTRHEVGRGQEILDWIDQQGFFELNVERYSKIGGLQPLDWPSNAQHSAFLTELFDGVTAKLERGEQTAQINVVSRAILGVALGMSGDRWGTRCQREFIIVEPNGDLNSCPDRAMHEAPFSNAMEGYEAFRSSPLRRKWIRIMDVDHKKPHCHTCEFRSWCNSGCPVTPNGPSEGQEECSGFKTYLKHVEAYLLSSKERYELCLEYAKPLGDPIAPTASLFS